VKKHANEIAAMKSIQTIEQAELMYSETYPSHGYACSLRALGGEPSAGTTLGGRGADFAELIWQRAAETATFLLSTIAQR
jgi:hypothetical protein